MLVYNLNLLLILALAYPLCVYKPSRIKKIAYLALTLGYMWFLSTFRFAIGFDYLSYINLFTQITEAGSLGELLSMPYEPGFLLLSRGMSLFVTSDEMMYGIYAALILFPVGWFIYHYSKEVWLSVWLYVTLAHFYASMNFIRQSLACSVALLGYKFLREKKLIPYLIVILLAATMHKTILIMIPVYFLSHIRLGKKMGIFYGGATLVLLLTSNVILNQVTNYIFTEYKGTYFLNPISTDIGYSLLFIVVPLFLFAGCLALRPIWEKRDPDANFFLNMMLFSLIAWVFITRHFILERPSQYMYILALVAVPSALSSLLASQEEVARLAQLKAGDKKKSKEDAYKAKELAQTISDHKKYYWSAVAAVVVLTWVYNEFGANVNGFHGVFPYQSVLSWLG